MKIDSTRKRPRARGRDIPMARMTPISPVRSSTDIDMVLKMARAASIPDPENGVIRFVGWIDTEELPPASYTLLAVLPNHQNRTMPDLSGQFQVLPR